MDERLPRSPRAQIRRFQAEADVLGHGEPRNAGKEAQADRRERDEHQGGAGKSERDGKRAARRVADHAAGHERQLRLKAVQAQAFQRRAREDQNRKSGERQSQHLRLDGAITPHHRGRAERDPPVGRYAEEIEKDVGDVGADHAAGVARDRVGGGMRPARIGAAVRGEDEQQVQRQHAEEKPLRFAEQSREPCRERRGPRDCSAAFVSYSQIIPAA